jgi:carbamoyl-phosphate synthase large subunit
VAQLEGYIDRATQVSPDHPVLVDRFLDDAIEIDVDALFDGHEMYLGGIMEHIEEAGIHSGDSACVLPPATLGARELERVRASTEAIARGVGVLGLLNVQFALAAGTLYVLEANPRASRTAPFVSKATGVPMAKAAARIMLGATIAELRVEGLLPARGDGGTLPEDSPVSVKEAVLPFQRFRTPDGKSVDNLLGPEMRSTGEVMGIASDFPRAFAKSQTAAYGGLPDRGTVFVSVSDDDKRAIIFPVKRLVDLGFTLLATEGTAHVLRRNGIPSTVVRKHSSGRGPDGEPTIVERIIAGEVDIVVNTPSGALARHDGYEIRAATVTADRPILTTVQQLAAAVQAIEAARDEPVQVTSLQVHTAAINAGRAAQDAAHAAAQGAAAAATAAAGDR